MNALHTPSVAPGHSRLNDRTPRAASSGFTLARVVALVAIAALAFGLVSARLSYEEPEVSVPIGAQAGDLIMEPCTYSAGTASYDADCGTLVVPENRRDPDTRLIALPVTRIRSTSDDPAEPIFHLEGGPGQSNMSFTQAGELVDRHDVVLVGYRGADGWSVLDCPEVESALKQSAALVGEESFVRSSEALADCAQRLTAEGVDLDGYSLPQQVDDLEAARTALGYDRINLVSESAGTRVALIYSWRYPESLHRSVMIGPNPPGRFLWDPEITDDQLAHYADLCAADRFCSSRTDDLVASMRRTAAAIPDRWWFLPIQEADVRASAMFGLFNTIETAAPMSAPMTIDTWLSGAAGDASGFWLMSLLGGIVLPEGFIWGEFAAAGTIDAEAGEAFYAAGGDPGSVLGSAATDFMWAGGRMAEAWPASPDHAEYRKVQRSNVETLLISGSVDFSTPAPPATDELLPFLPNGHQVILEEFGHTGDFWGYQPEARDRLLTTFFDSGQVDDSRYTRQEVQFDVGGPTHATMAKVLVGTLGAGALLAVALLAWMARRVRRRGGFGPKTSAWLRTLSPIVHGVGGWFLGLLIAMTFWPATDLAGQPIAALSMGSVIGLGSYLAWVRRDRPGSHRQGLAAALAGALVGAWLGFAALDGLAAVLSTLVGAALGANLALILRDVAHDVASAGDPVDVADTGARPNDPARDVVVGDSAHIP